MKDQKIILVDEKLHQSIYRDTVSIGLLIFGFWFSYNYVGDSYILETVLAFVFIIWMFGKSPALVKKMNGPDALKYLKEKYETEKDAA